MPLLTTTQQTTARIAERGRNIVSHIAAAASQANQQTADVLALDNDQLSAWLQENGAQLESMLTAHKQLGDLLNQAAAVAAAILGDTAPPVGLVDTRPLADKLAEQGRQIDFATLTVSNMPIPEPEPQPEEPQP